MPTFLDWSGSTITFDRDDHPDHVPQPGRYPLVIDPIIGNTWLTKVLLDRGSGLNIMYAQTLDAMGISWTQLYPSGAPFHSIVPGKWALPLRQIDLSVTFGEASNFRKETLTWHLPSHVGAAMLCEVHSHPKLHLP
jgi:hypothetical protein